MQVEVYKFQSIVSSPAFQEPLLLLNNFLHFYNYQFIQFTLSMASN